LPPRVTAAQNYGDTLHISQAPFIDERVMCKASPEFRNAWLRGKVRQKMQLGMIGLGRMGGTIVRRLMRKGHGLRHACGGRVEAKAAAA
jgi:hypothetical protein